MGGLKDAVLDSISRATLTDWALLLGGSILVVFLLGTWQYDFFRKRGIPSTRPRFPFIGDTVASLIGRQSFIDLVKELYDQGKDHAMFGFFELHRPMYMVRDTELLKIFAVKAFDHFMNRRGFSSEESNNIFSKNLFALKDQRWRNMRATLSPAFTTSKIKGMFPYMSQCGEQMVSHIQEKYKAEGGGKPVSTDMKELFSRVANDIIATTAFGVQCDSLQQPNSEFYKMGKDLTNFSSSRTFLFILSFLFPGITKVVDINFVSPKATKYFEKIVRETMKEREEKKIFRPDVLQLLLQAKAGELKADAADADEDEKVKADKINIDDDYIVAQTTTFFFAGFDTVSTVLCFTTFALSLHQEAQRLLQEEIDEVLQQTGGKLTYEIVQGMKYLEMVINEALRRYPPLAAFDRVCSEAVTLPSTDSTPSMSFKKGDVINIPVIGIHQDPKYWPDPMAFMPERFSEENKHNIKPFSFLPFGVGPRICIAQRFAFLEVKIILVHLLANFDLHLSKKTRLPMEYANGVNMSIKGGFWCDILPRNRPTVS